MRLETIVNQPTIEADRFTLRPLRRSDAGLLSLYAGDKRVSWNTSSIPHPQPPGAVEAFIDRSMAEVRTHDAWALDGTKLGSEELLGVVGLTRMDRDQSELGYWVAPALWNSGLASEAVRAMIAANPPGGSTRTISNIDAQKYSTGSNAWPDTTRSTESAGMASQA